MALSKDQIFGASDRKTETVNVPEWGGDVILKTISLTDRDQFDNSLYKVVDGDVVPQNLNADARLLVKCVVGEDGERIFDDKDAAGLAEKSAPVVSRLAKRARKLNSIGSEEQEIEEAGKDSKPDQSDDSTSS